MASTSERMMSEYNQLYSLIAFPSPSFKIVSSAETIFFDVTASALDSFGLKLPIMKSIIFSPFGFLSFPLGVEGETPALILIKSFVFTLLIIDSTPNAFVTSRPFSKRNFIFAQRQINVIVNDNQFFRFLF